ncbi:hypothetical protein KCP76_14675 [Salmonella enterica subsp. enterica serovar Weltevreden]|nr:hypothetical protein KCP76_14675 [Salmonella enterica subsp. enterica serovar Weltevreden]
MPDPPPGDLFSGPLPPHRRRHHLRQRSPQRKPLLQLHTQRLTSSTTQPEALFVNPTH